MRTKPRPRKSHERWLERKAERDAAIAAFERRFMRGLSTFANEQVAMVTGGLWDDPNRYGDSPRRT